MWSSGYDATASFQDSDHLYNSIPGGDFYLDITGLINDAAEGKLRLFGQGGPMRLDSVLILFSD